MCFTAKRTSILFRCLLISGSILLHFGNAQLKVTHIDWKAYINFVTETIEATATYEVTRDPSVWTVLLDASEDLVVTSVSSPYVAGDVAFRRRSPNSDNGSAILVQIPDNAPEVFTFVIAYQTSPEANGLVWASKGAIVRDTDSDDSSAILVEDRRPLFYTQITPRNARSLIPCQEMPEAKFTFSAHVEVPDGMNAVMGASVVQVTKSPTARTLTYHFVQHVPISSSMFALVVGVLESCELATNRYVYARKTDLNKSVAKISEIKMILMELENMLGSRLFSLLNIVVLPVRYLYVNEDSSSPVALIPRYALDEQTPLTDLLAHKVVRSHLDSLITPKNRRHVWITKALESFYTLKILQKLNGSDFANMHTRLLVDTLAVALSAKTGEKSKLVSLDSELDPEDIDIIIVTVKGFLLLKYLEEVIEGTPDLTGFVVTFIRHFREKTVDTSDFVNYFKAYYHNNAALNKIDWDKWLYGMGDPPVMPTIATKWDSAVKSLKEKWENEDTDFSSFNKNDISDWPSIEIASFLQNLNITEENVEENQPIFTMDEVYNFSESGNVLVVFNWLTFCLNARYEPAVKDVTNFVRKGGEAMYALALLKQLSEWPEYSREAARLYLEISQKVSRQLLDVVEAML